MNDERERLLFLEMLGMYSATFWLNYASIICVGSCILHTVFMVYFLDQWSVCAFLHLGT